MDEELLGYVNYKWMVSAIYREHGYIEEYCKEDKEFEQNFFCKINLDHIIQKENRQKTFIKKNIR